MSNTYPQQLIGINNFDSSMEEIYFLRKKIRKLEEERDTLKQVIDNNLEVCIENDRVYSERIADLITSLDEVRGELVDTQVNLTRMENIAKKMEGSAKFWRNEYIATRDCLKEYQRAGLGSLISRRVRGLL